MDPQDSQPEDTSSFCNFCQTFAKELSTHPSTWESTTRTYTSSTTVFDILRTASNCQLCEFIISSKGYVTPGRLGTIKTYFASFKYRLQPTAKPIRVSLETRFNKLAHCILQIPLWLVYKEAEEAKIHLHISADDGSPAAISGAVTATRPASSSYTCLQIQSWLGSCLLQHECCRHTLGGRIIDESSEPVLPKRVVSISDASSVISVVLLETNGLRGHYTALSHCWGPVDRQPLRTTKETIGGHLKGIEFGILPKSFQDAIVVTRAIGLHYLWIDSLCIMQDDEREWEEESKKMGSIYENARLTIAAADAKNSSQGCFIWETKRTPVISIPYYSSISSALSTILVSETTEGLRRSVPYSVLGTRGWALQEWRISRRIVFFTAGGASWKCKQNEFGPYNEACDLWQYPGWGYLLQDYCSRRLTYKSDRLAALDGLANEMQKSRQDQYHFGMWSGNLPEHLLWSKYAYPVNETEDIPELPSWTWASRGGRKTFWSNRRIEWSREIANKHIAVVENTMQIRGCIKPCIASLYEVDVASARISFNDPLYDFALKSRLVYYILDGETTQKVVGKVSFDSRPCDDNIYCLFLMTSPADGFVWREYEDPGDEPGDEPYPDVDRNYPDFKAMFKPAKLSDPEQAQKPKIVEDSELSESSSDKESELAESSSSENQEDNPIQALSLSQSSSEELGTDLEQTDMYSESMVARETEPHSQSEESDSSDYMGYDEQENSDAGSRSPTLKWPEETFAHDYNQGVYINWVLMLKPVVGKKDTFRRVGMGFVASNSWAENSRVQKLVHIV